MRNSAARRRLLRRWIESEDISSQQELVERLDEAGYQATQATVSRDLKEMGVIKHREKGSGRYVLGRPMDSDAAMEGLRRVLNEFVLVLSASGNLVLANTPPGAAQVVGAAVDSAGIEGILGSVAGDDTLLVVVDEKLGGAAMLSKLEEIGAES